MVLETHMKLCITELDFRGNFFLSQKLGKWTQWTKTVFLLENLLIFTEFDL